MGVWIETALVAEATLKYLVTPCMGVWIETVAVDKSELATSVTPCMGVWIETGLRAAIAATLESHTLYGCVD